MTVKEARRALGEMRGTVIDEEHAKEVEDMLDEDDVDLTAWLNGDWVSQGSD